MPHRDLPVSAAHIRAAANRIRGMAVYTPLLSSPELDALAGGRILLKAECLQRTGSFKFRGAFNRISQIEAGGAQAGVVAYSSGNHAQGVAAAARISGLSATIVMPGDTPAVKRRNTQAHGATVVTYDRATEDREAIAHRIAAQTGAVVVPPFDDCDVIAGQGTVGLEFCDQARALRVEPDAVLVCHGGGGLTAGIAVAVGEEFPDAEIFGVEPKDFDDLSRSLISGVRMSNEKATGSICDALLSPSPGEITFAINRQLLNGGLTVSDDEVRHAVAFAFDRLKLVLEPGGAVALAAILSGKIDCQGRTVVAILSGGNIDSALFCEIVNGPPVR